MVETGWLLWRLERRAQQEVWQSWQKTVRNILGGVESLVKDRIAWWWDVSMNNAKEIAFDFLTVLLNGGMRLILCHKVAHGLVHSIVEVHVRSANGGLTQLQKFTDYLMRTWNAIKHSVIDRGWEPSAHCDHSDSDTTASVTA